MMVQEGRLLVVVDRRGRLELTGSAEVRQCTVRFPHLYQTQPPTR